MDRLSSIRDLFDSAYALASNGPGTDRNWSPALDVYEDKDTILVELELAGVEKESFDLSLESDVLTIRGERKESDNKQNGESFRSERFFGTFTRSVTLPSPVQPDKVQATYKQGVLTVELPKAEEAKPKKIDVKII